MIAKSIGKCRIVLSALSIIFIIYSPISESYAKPSVGENISTLASIDGNFCTITNNYPHLGIGITAKHCTLKGYEVKVKSNKRWVNYGTVIRKGGEYDYSIISMDESIITKNHTAIYKGETKTIKKGDEVCSYGGVSGHSCGKILQHDQDGWISSLCSGPGDSGSPVFKDGKIIGIVTRGIHRDKYPACYSPNQIGEYAPVRILSIDKIDARIN